MAYSHGELMYMAGASGFTNPGAAADFYLQFGKWPDKAFNGTAPPASTSAPGANPQTGVTDPANRAPTADELRQIQQAIQNIASSETSKGFPTSLDEATKIFGGQMARKSDGAFQTGPAGVPGSFLAKPGLDWAVLEETTRSAQAREQQARDDLAFQKGNAIGQVDGKNTLDSVKYANEILANPQNAALAEQIRKGFALGPQPGETVAEYLNRSLEGENAGQPGSSAPGSGGGGGGGNGGGGNGGGGGGGGSQPPATGATPVPPKTGSNKSANTLPEDANPALKGIREEAVKSGTNTQADIDRTRAVEQKVAANNGKATPQEMAFIRSGIPDTPEGRAEFARLTAGRPAQTTYGTEYYQNVADPNKPMVSPTDGSLYGGESPAAFQARMRAQQLQEELENTPKTVAGMAAWNAKAAELKAARAEMTKQAELAKTDDNIYYANGKTASRKAIASLTPEAAAAYAAADAGKSAPPPAAPAEKQWTQQEKDYINAVAKSKGEAAKFPAGTTAPAASRPAASAPAKPAATAAPAKQYTAQEMAYFKAITDQQNAAAQKFASGNSMSVKPSTPPKPTTTKPVAQPKPTATPKATSTPTPKKVWTQAEKDYINAVAKAKGEAPKFAGGGFYGFDSADEAMKFRDDMSPHVRNYAKAVMDRGFGEPEGTDEWGRFGSALRGVDTSIKGEKLRGRLLNNEEVPDAELQTFYRHMGGDDKRDLATIREEIMAMQLSPTMPSRESMAVEGATSGLSGLEETLSAYKPKWYESFVEPHHSDIQSDMPKGYRPPAVIKEQNEGFKGELTDIVGDREFGMFKGRVVDEILNDPDNYINWGKVEKLVGPETTAQLQNYVAQKRSAGQWQHTEPMVERAGGGGVVVGGQPHWIVDNNGVPKAALTEDSKPEAIVGQPDGVEVIPLDPARRAAYEARRQSSGRGPMPGMPEVPELKKGGFLSGLKGLGKKGTSARTAPSRRPGASSKNTTRTQSGTRAVLSDKSKVNTKAKVNDARANNGKNQGKSVSPSAADLLKKAVSSNKSDKDAASVKPKAMTGAPLAQKVAARVGAKPVAKPPTAKVTPGAAYAQPIMQGPTSLQKPAGNVVTAPGFPSGPVVGGPMPAPGQVTAPGFPVGPKIGVPPNTTIQPINPTVSIPRPVQAPSPVTLPGQVKIQPVGQPKPLGPQMKIQPVGQPTMMGPSSLPTAVGGVSQPPQFGTPVPGAQNNKGIFIGSGGNRTIGNNIAGARFGFDRNAPSAIAGQNQRIGIPNNPGVGVLAAHKIAPGTLRKMTSADRQMFESQIRASGQDPASYFEQAAYAEPQGANTGRSFV